VQVGEEDKIFGSVTAIDIAECLKKEGIEIDKKSIHMEDPIKTLGVFSVPIRIAPEVEAKLKVWVVKAD
jgi:large subunit ribosomal protein L9